MMFLGGGLITGGIMTVNASGECSREACDDDDKCSWFGNMTTCTANDISCTDGPCSGPPEPPTDPVEY